MKSGRAVRRHAVMFVDEAEAFLAKRGEVKSAQDHWTMRETDYLLQRIESYTGAVIFATNPPPRRSTKASSAPSRSSSNSRSRNDPSGKNSGCERCVAVSRANRRDYAIH